MEEGRTLSAELARDFDMEAGELTPELQLCIARLEELRRREADPDDDRISIAQKFFPLRAPTSDHPIELSLVSGLDADIRDLRAKAYERAGWIADETSIVRDDFDRSPTAIAVAATSGGRLVGTIRVSVRPRGLASAGMPCELEFPAKLGGIIQTLPHGKFAEFCRVAVDPDIGSRSFRTTLYGSLVRAAVMVAWAAEVDYALVAVHAAISRFYQHMCGFERLATSRGYGIIKEPTHLLGADFAALVRRTSERSGFFHIGRDEVRRVGEHLRKAHPALFVDKSDAIKIKFQSTGSPIA